MTSPPVPPTEPALLVACPDLATYRQIAAVADRQCPVLGAAADRWAGFPADAVEVVAADDPRVRRVADDAAGGNDTGVAPGDRPDRVRPVGRRVVLALDLEGVADAAAVLAGATGR